jgi:MATE family multidrug resistance protein
LYLALPLILSNSFWTLQITIDSILLSWYSSEAVGGAWAAAQAFWVPAVLLQFTAQYAMTFVAQYVGAGRPERVGPVIWQSLWFSVGAGLAFLLLWPWIPGLVQLAGHPPDIEELEAVYLRCLCFAALPLLLKDSAISFFLGRGRNWPILVVNAVGMIVNAALGYAWIFGAGGLPRWGVAGAGWAVVVSSWVAAALALVLVFASRQRREFALLRGWRFDAALFGRLMRFGLPSGLHFAIEMLAFNIVVLLIGQQGKVPLAATAIAFRLSTLAFLPSMGIAQAVSALVGRRLGENRPDLAQRSAWSGFAVAWSFMALVGLTYVLLPDLYVWTFRPDEADPNWPQVAALVPILLRFVAVYCLVDSMGVVFGFALKGAGDTRFVTIASVSLAWPLMVLPTVVGLAAWSPVSPSWLDWYDNGKVYWAWSWITLYVICLAFVFLIRFRQGRWKGMRVIEDRGDIR